MSRLETSSGDQRKGFIDIEIPVFYAEYVESTPNYPSAAFTFEEDVNPPMEDTRQTGITENEDDPTDTPPPNPIPVEEFADEQIKDPIFRHLAASAGMPKSEFNFNSQSLLVQTSELDGAIQKLVPAALQEKVIKLSHSPISQGHHGETSYIKPCDRNSTGLL